MFSVKSCVAGSHAQKPLAFLLNAHVWRRRMYKPEQNASQQPITIGAAFVSQVSTALADDVVEPRERTSEPSVVWKAWTDADLISMVGPRWLQSSQGVGRSRRLTLQLT